MFLVITTAARSSLLTIDHIVEIINAHIYILILN